MSKIYVVFLFLDIIVSGGLENITIYLVKSNISIDKKVILGNVFDQMIENNNVELLSFILNYKDNNDKYDTDLVLNNNVKHFFEQYDQYKIKNKYEDEIIYYLIKNKSISVGIMMKLEKHFNKYIRIYNFN